MGESFENKTFVFTGEMSIPREDAQCRVVMLGGRITTAVSGKTTYLVTGSEPGPSKIAKAKTLKITILTEQQFMKMLDENEKGVEQTFTIKNTNPEKSDVKKTKVKKTSEPWCEKYRPKRIEDIVGNHSSICQLKDFLQGRNSKKAVLIGGSPGIGKTTAATLICKDLGYDIIEFNASDTRNKSEISKKIKDTMNFYGLGLNGLKNKVLIMDEIDGMTSDRGGLGELNLLIKNTKIPIICICNDMNNPKIKTIFNNCLNIKFKKLMASQMIPRLTYILSKEGKEIKESFINEIVKISHGDMRYCLNTLQHILLKESITYEELKGLVRKNVTKNIFDVCAEIFHKGKIVDKIDLYFEDYSNVPNFVHENYLNADYKNIDNLKVAAESISISDNINKMIYGPNQEWGLLSIHAFYSCINPAKDRFLGKRIEYPRFLGQNSKRNKNSRNLSETLLHASSKIRMNRKEFRIACLDLLFKKYISYLREDKIDKAIELLVEYDLLKTDMDSLGDIVFGGNEMIKNINTKSKSAFTRAYKKIVRKLPYIVEETKKVVRNIDDDNDDEENMLIEE